LIAPLNWGLGHATRCIPLIQRLQEEGNTIILASDGRALKLLELEFPELTTLSLPAHNIYYGQRFFALSIFFQLPKIAYITILEHFRLKKIVKQYAIDTIISDNRFGCFHPRKESVFITHQLNLLIPNAILQGIARWINKRWINTFFDECWIPDVESKLNLSGVLSHHIALPNLRYIGILSRMKSLKQEKKYDWIAVLSGPEPQRSILEKMILEQAQLIEQPFKALIIGGKSEVNEQIKINESLEYISFLSTIALNEAICASKIIICRSGYSTLMDLAKTGSKALLIPTPRQTEQEYLATHFMEQGIFYSQNQDGFDLEKGLKKATDYTGFTI